MKKNSGVVEALLDHGVDPLYPARFVDAITGEVLEERTARLSEIAARAGLPTDAGAMAALMDAIGVQLASGYGMVDGRFSWAAFWSKPWTIGVPVRQRVEL